MLSAVLLQIVASILPGIEIDDWRDASWTALIITVIQSGVMMVWSLAPERGLLLWQLYAALFVLNTAALGLASMVLDGLKVRGFLSLVLAGAILTLANYAISAGLPYFMARGVGL